MRVAVLNTNWFPDTGGGQVHVREVYNRLVSNHGCDVTVFTKQTEQEDDGDYLFEVKQLPRTDLPFRPLNELNYTVGVLQEIISGEYDLVHAHTNTATFPMQCLRVMSDIPIVFTVHGSNLDFSVTYSGGVKDSLYTLVQQLIIKKFKYDYTISVSQELAEKLVSYQSPVGFIPNGVDPAEFPDPMNFDSKQLLFVGRLRPKKNVGDIITAMEHIVERHPDATLHVVGEGPLQAELEEQISKSGLQNVVELHGYVSDEKLYSLYAESALFVLPSEWEGHPLVLLEAWASGLPVVGTDVEGIREFVITGENGSLVPLNSPKVLAETITELLAEPSNIKQLGQTAHEKATTEFSWEVTAKKTHKVYKQVTSAERIN